MLNIEQYEYYYDPKHRQSGGFQVAVFDYGTEPMIEDQGFGIAPGTNSLVGLEVTEVSRVYTPNPFDSSHRE